MCDQSLWRRVWEHTHTRENIVRQQRQSLGVQRLARTPNQKPEEAGREALKASEPVAPTHTFT